MSLPAPRLDDRTFQQIVDESKRQIHRLCPEWTDHNVSDPGVALIELNAWMTEMILYRLNQVPDRLYVKFLELIGIELYGPAAAETDVLFKLIAPQQEQVSIPAGTQVSTEQVGEEEPIVFMTDDRLDIVPPDLISCVTESDEQFKQHSDELRRTSESVVCFRSLRPGDAFYLGFRHSLRGNLIRLHIVTADVEGTGVNPKYPPLRWETWTDTEWEVARVLDDQTYALNCPEGGDISLLLAHKHEQRLVDHLPAFWLRCTFEPEPGREDSTYNRSPELVSVRAVSLGGAIGAHHAEAAPEELLGVSDGEPGQSFQVRRTPVLPRVKTYETVRMYLPSRGGMKERESELWTEIDDFGLAEDSDRVFTWSSATGEIRFGPRLIERDGRTRQHGAIPPMDSQVFVTGYRHGGGRQGNVGIGRLTVPRTSLPFVASVTNLDPARGGVDAESIENAKIRGPLSLRSGDRAVTAEDFERLTLQADRTVGRAHCPPPQPGQPVRVLVVPKVHVPADALRLSDLALGKPLVTAVAKHLDRRRLLTTRIQIDEPFYQGVMVQAEIGATVGMRAESIEQSALTALYEYINPVTGGRDRRGWGFGQSLTDSDIHALLLGVPGVAMVVRVYFIMVLDLRKGELHHQELQRVAIPPNALLMSYDHQVRVRR